MGILTINDLALQAFSVSDAVASWRDLVIKQEQARNQVLIETEYVRLAESYTRSAAADSYLRQSAQDSYGRRAAENSYSRSASQNVYSRQSAQDYYTRQSAQDSYSQSSAVNSYSRRASQNYYSQASYTNYYSRSSGSDSYSQASSMDSYSRTTGQDSYSRQAARNAYSRTTAADTYSRKVAANYYSRMDALNYYSRTEMQDSYSRSLFRNSYSRSALQNTYTRQAAANYYTRQAAANYYSRQTAQNSYSRQTAANSYSRQSASNYYGRQTAQNSYSRQSALNYYGRSSGSNSYTRRSAQNSYSRANSTYRRLGVTSYSRSNSYSRSSAQNSYSRVASYSYYSRSSAQNSYSRSSASNYYSRSSAANSYSRATAQNSYSRQTAIATYTRTSAQDSYTRLTAQDSYSRVAHTDSHTDGYYNNSGQAAIYIDYYSRATLQDYYGRRTATNYYTQQTGLDSYSRQTAANYYTRQTASDSYTRYSTSNYYSRQAALNSYTRSAYANYYSESSGSNYYSRSSALDSYSRASASDYYAKVTSANAYARSSALDSYSRSSALDSYSRSESENTYKRSAAVNSYSRAAGQDTYTPEVDTGFDHKNYIPSSPCVYELEGTVVSGELDVRLASYDKNADGFGDQDADSINIKYNVMLRQTEDADGKKLSESESPYVALATNASTPDLNFDVAELPDGEYCLATVALNVPRGDKTYESDTTYTNFTIANALMGADLTILNSNEFYDYIYGQETYVNRADEIKKYVDSVLYGAPASQTQQKGLFLVIDLNDEDVDTYHEVKVGLIKGTEVVTPTIYPVIFNGGNIPGDKTGYAFIPLDAMLTGDFADVNIELSLTEYFDAAHKNIKGKTGKAIGVSSLKDVLYIGIDSSYPDVSISAPTQRAISQKITIECSDSGLGIRDFYYQVVKAGEDKSDKGWIEIAGTSKLIEFNNAGDYDLYVKAVDLAGNETIKCQEDIQVAFLNIDVDSPRVTKPGESFDVTTIITTDLDVEDIKYYLQDSEGNKITPSLIDKHTIGEYERSEYEGALTFPSTTPLGQYYITVEVTLSDGSVEIITKPIRLVDSYGVIEDDVVSHTPKWEENRLLYNAENDPDRPLNVFWAGEAFVVSADIKFTDVDTVNEGCLLKTVTISGTDYLYDFTSYIESGAFYTDTVVDLEGIPRLHQEGLLWDENMITDWKDGAVLTFVFEYTDGTIHEKTVIVDRTTEYYQYHRKM